ncbi:MAG TPA: hypothetical protein VL262_13765 [Vicinamibacterales bacterium]|nr:hypothetical protein [Vicinamibacterales bacterium]
MRAWRAATEDGSSQPPGQVLGTWVATALARDGCDLLLALETETCLTIVCELGSETTFAGRWKQALEAAFAELAVPLARLTPDVCSPRLRAIAGGPLDTRLATAAFVCDTELHFHTDLRLVQAQLNEFPFDHPPHYVPAIAVRRLFGTARRR